MVLQPVGPQPPTVYWRRRALLVAGVLIVLLVLLKACTGGGSGGRTAAPVSRDSTADAASAAALVLGGGLDDPSPAASGDPSAAGGSAAVPATTPGASARAAAPSPSPSAARAGGSCSDRDLQVRVTTDATSYPPGASKRLTLSVTNTSSASCRRDLGSAALTLVVRSGADRVWSSDDCGGAGASSLRTLAAGASYRQTVAWSGKRSAPGACGPTRPVAKAGTYTVRASVGSATGAAARFTLR